MLLKARARALEGVRRLARRHGHSIKDDQWIAQLYHPHIYRPKLLCVVHGHARVINQSLDFVGVVIVCLKSYGEKPSGCVTEQKPDVVGQRDVRRSGCPEEYVREIIVITD